MKEVLRLMANQVGRVVLTNLRGQYHVVMSWNCVFILYLCYGHVMLRDTSTEWKQCDLRHVGTSIDGGNILEARLPGKDNVVSGCVILLLCICCICCTCCTCDVVCMRCCVYMVLCTFFYAMLCTNGVVYSLFMQCYVQMVLCTCCLCNVMYIRCYEHVVYVVICTDGVVCLLYIFCMQSWV